MMGEHSDTQLMLLWGRERCRVLAGAPGLSLHPTRGGGPDPGIIREQSLMGQVL